MIHLPLPDLRLNSIPYSGIIFLANKRFPGMRGI